MAFLIPVQYHNCRYPEDIQPNIVEVAGNFDIAKVSVTGEYSLHTEYSFMGRKFDSSLVRKRSAICEANKGGIPMLWYSREWAVEFADFITDLTQGCPPPKIVEIHPPFSDYCNLLHFSDYFRTFHSRIREHFPDVTILIENRSGSRYSGGKFIISSIEQLLEISRIIDQEQHHHTTSKQNG